jgi:hypothetical protein
VFITVPASNEEAATVKLTQGNTAPARGETKAPRPSLSVCFSPRSVQREMKSSLGSIHEIPRCENVLRSGGTHPQFLISALQFFAIPYYLQYVQVHSSNCTQIYTITCRRGFSSPVL